MKTWAMLLLAAIGVLGCSTGKKAEPTTALPATASREPTAPLTAEEFDAATAEDFAIAGDEEEGRQGRGVRDSIVEYDNAPPPGVTLLSPAELHEWTREDFLREGDEAEEGEAEARVGGAVMVSSRMALAPPPPNMSKWPVLTLSREWVEESKNRVTVTTNFIVVGASRVHDVEKGGDDGDIHIGGVAESIGLPIVCEIMNAASPTAHDAVAMAKNLAKDEGATEIAGAWRIWCEHPGVPQVQFGETPYEGHPSNPDHVFEVHPATTFGGIDVSGTVVAIPGYEAYNAAKAFKYYESIPCDISFDDDTVTIRTPVAKYNYAHFVIRLEEDGALVAEDGRIRRCSVLDDQDRVVAKNRRMIFIRGTEPHQRVKDLKTGDTLHVLGIPRMNLAVVSWRVRNAEARPEVLSWRLPYEMIVVGTMD